MSKSSNCRVKTLAALALAGATLLATSASAMDTFMVGPRAAGMAGANVASASDLSAQYYNPAAFAFMGMMGENAEGEAVRYDSDNNNLGRKDWGIDLNAGFGYRMNNDFGALLDDLSAIDQDSLSVNGIRNADDLNNIINLAHDLGNLDNPGNAASLATSGSLGLRVLHFGIGARSYLQATGWVKELDEGNLGINVSNSDINADIQAVDMPSDYDNGYTPSVFDSTQRSDLANQGLSSESIDRLDYVANQAGISAANAPDTVDLLVLLLGQAGTTTSLEDNKTVVRLQGFGLVEVPISYGYAFNEHFGIGGNIKLMRGRVYGNEVLVMDNNSGDALDSFDKQYQETTTFGLDLGLMARFPKINLGLVCRNLNGPTFDGFTPENTPGFSPAPIKEVKLDPQLALGAALIPFETLTLELDLDLTANETALSGYDTRNLGLGLEWDAFRFLALRVGAYKNLAESDIGVVYAAGVGLNLWAVRADVGGTFSSSTEQFDGEDVPKEFNVQAQLSIDF